MQKVCTPTSVPVPTSPSQCASSTARRGHSSLARCLSIPSFLPLTFQFIFFSSIPLCDSAGMPQVQRHRRCQTQRRFGAQTRTANKKREREQKQKKSFFGRTKKKKVNDFAKICTGCSFRPHFLFCPPLCSTIRHPWLNHLSAIDLQIAV